MVEVEVVEDLNYSDDSDITVFVCQFCSGRYESIETVKQHVVEKNMMLLKPCMKTFQEPFLFYECPFCGQLFKKKVLCLEHIKTLCQENCTVDKPDSPLIPVKFPSQFWIPPCKKTLFATESDCQVHIHSFMVCLIP